ncbi:SRPBCC domain-containing protein [Gracilibacillus saliphilus]|uniref:SRPBCC domain-containing protein n=1 Tax=Gracilibacillus saliphilus TaxID=543890 RepID=UPI0013D2BF95|nr:SRPBCC domain-containing protein [Gracilibacillus saliphilus]
MNYGTLSQHDERYSLTFEYEFPFSSEKVFAILIDPAFFTQWYPFATTEMDVEVGGKLKFDDEEGSVYEGEVLELKAPHTFVFKEVDDLLDMRITGKEDGCLFTFKHSFDDASMAMYMAAGWHRCLEVFQQLVYGEPVEWKDNAEALRQYYKNSFEEGE